MDWLAETAKGLLHALTETFPLALGVLLGIPAVVIVGAAVRSAVSSRSRFLAALALSCVGILLLRPAARGVPWYLLAAFALLLCIPVGLSSDRWTPEQYWRTLKTTLLVSMAIAGFLWLLPILTIVAIPLFVFVLLCLGYVLLLVVGAVFSYYLSFALPSLMQEDDGVRSPALSRGSAPDGESAGQPGPDNATSEDSAGLLAALFSEDRLIVTLCVIAYVIAIALFLNSIYVPVRVCLKGDWLQVEVIATDYREEDVNDGSIIPAQAYVTVAPCGTPATVPSPRRYAVGQLVPVRWDCGINRGVVAEQGSGLFKLVFNYSEIGGLAGVFAVFSLVAAVAVAVARVVALLSTCLIISARAWRRVKDKTPPGGRHDEGGALTCVLSAVLVWIGALVGVGAWVFAALVVLEVEDCPSLMLGLVLFMASAYALLPIPEILASKLGGARGAQGKAGCC